MRVAVLVLTAAVLPAAELVVRDISLGLEVLPTSFEYTLDDPVGGRSGTDAFDSSYALTVDGLYSLAPTGAAHGTLVGFGIAASRSQYATGLLSSYQARGRLGYAWAATDQLAFLASGVAGPGLGNFSLDGGTQFSSYEARGPLVGLGAQAGIIFAITEKWVVRAEAGWRRDQARLSGDGKDLDLTASGLVYSLSLGWRTTATPSLLE